MCSRAGTSPKEWLDTRAKTYPGDVKRATYNELLELSSGCEQDSRVNEIYAKCLYLIMKFTPYASRRFDVVMPGWDEDTLKTLVTNRCYEGMNSHDAYIDNWKEQVAKAEFVIFKTGSDSEHWPGIYVRDDCSGSFLSYEEIAVVAGIAFTIFPRLAHHQQDRILPEIIYMHKALGDMEKGLGFLLSQGKGFAVEKDRAYFIEVSDVMKAHDASLIIVAADPSDLPKSA